MLSIAELKKEEKIKANAILFQHNHYWWLSNFHLLETPIMDEYGLKYATTEHFYQSRKSQDPDVWKKFSLQVSPTMSAGLAKKEGKKLENDLCPFWHEVVKYGVMRRAIEMKFRSNPELHSMLMETKGEQLIEWTTWGDRCWGMCCFKKEGANALGKLLQEYRDAHG